MANTIKMSAARANTTRLIEFQNPTTGAWQTGVAQLDGSFLAIFTGIPAGSYSNLKARLVGSNPAIEATWPGPVIVTAGETTPVPTVPGPVTQLDTVAGNAQVTVEVEAPASGGAAIQSYRYEYRPTGATSWSVAGTTANLSYTITGLANGTDHQFRVFATNSVGTSAAGTVVSATPVASTSTFTFDFSASSANLLYNVLDEPASGFRARSGFAQTNPITTDCTSVEITIQTQGGQAEETAVHVFKGGQPFAVAVPESGPGLGTPTLRKVTVDLGAGSKEASFREGPAGFFNGTYYNYPITKLVFSGGTFATMNTPALAQNVLIIFGTSMMSSVSNTNSLLGIVPRLRAMPAFASWRIASTAASAGYCVGRFPSQANIVHLVDQLIAYVGTATGKVVIYDEDLTNNYGFGAGLEEFKRVKAAIWDEIRRRKPTWRILAQNATHRNDENVAVSGFVLADYDYNFGGQDYSLGGNVPAYALSEIVDARSNYVRKTANAHAVIGAANYRDNLHPNLGQGDANLAAFIAGEVLNTPATVGTDVYVPPVVQDEVLYDYDFSEGFTDQSANNVALTNNGVTLDAAQQAAYFNGAGTLTRTLNAKDTYPRGFIFEFELKAETSQDTYFGTGQGGGDYRLALQNTGGGKGYIIATCTPVSGPEVVLTSQEINLVTAFIGGTLSWNRSTLRLQVAGGQAVSAPMASIKTINGTVVSIGSALNSGSNFKGWVRRWKMTSAGSGEVIVAEPQLSSVTPNSAGKEEVVTITGVNFGSAQNASYVDFGGNVAEVTSWAATSITVKVPIAASGTTIVQVTTNAGTSNGLPFTVTATSGVARRYDFPISEGQDLSGNGLNLVSGSSVGGPGPTITAAGAVFNQNFFRGAFNYRDTYDQGWDFTLKVVEHTTPYEAYYGYVGLGASISLISQLVDGQLIYKLFQYDAAGNLILLNADPISPTAAVTLHGSWRGGVLTLQVNGGTAKTIACPSIKPSPAGQMDVFVGQSGGASLARTTLESLEIRY